MSVTSRPESVATLAGGCFWCLEAVYLRLAGVLGVKSGYMGGHTANPTYRDVCEGDTGHAEVVQVRFDPAVVDFAGLLEVFFAIHDPTTPDRQGNDVGSQYRSAIFFHDAQQERVARDTIAALERDGAFADPVVTQVVPAAQFHPAEDHHDDYFARNPNQPYCRFVVGPKVEKFLRRFPRQATGR